MTPETFNLSLAFIIAHATVIWGVIRFTVGRIVDWTHMQRDINELKERVKSLELDIDSAHDKLRQGQKTL